MYVYSSLPIPEIYAWNMKSLDSVVPYPIYLLLNLFAYLIALGGYLNVVNVYTSCYL